MSKINCSYTDEVVCPHCRYEFSDSWEFADFETFECYECGKEFKIFRHVEVTYSTEKL